jgi:hypothetical protein
LAAAVSFTAENSARAGRPIRESNRQTGEDPGRRRVAQA